MVSRGDTSMIWIEVFDKLSTVGVVWIELLQVHTYACMLCVQKSMYPRVNFCLFHGLCLNRFPTPDLRLQSVLDFLQVSCLAKTNKEVCYSGIRIGLGGQCEKTKRFTAYYAACV